MRRTPGWSAAVLFALACLPSLAYAGPWTRERGHFFLSLGYSRISADKFFAPDFSVVPIARYTQHQLSLYGEVGLISRWLTATVESTLFRHNGIVDAGATYGLGDLRVGFWTGLVVKPVRLSFGVTIGAPTGDPAPRAKAGADIDAQLIAASLPTGDGEWDVEGRASLGYSFGGARRWPVIHYLVVEAGYWLRAGFADSFVYRVELGTKFPWRFVDRFWVALRLNGVESFASQREAAQNATGLGNGVTFIAYGVQLYGRIYRGLGASLTGDSAFRARSVAAGANIMAAITYQW